MRSLIAYKKQAIALRRQGLSYGEILKSVPVAKSTLSLWLRDAPLTQAEKSVLKGRTDANISTGRIRAAAALRELRLKRDTDLRKVAELEFEKFKGDPFFHAGLCLYWAEGSKRGNTFVFVNTDPEMILFILRWMQTYLGIAKESVAARLYLHKLYAHEQNEGIWSVSTGIPLKNFRRSIYKPSGKLFKKRPAYMGCLRIELGKVIFFRKYQFWHKMMLEHFKNQR